MATQGDGAVTRFEEAGCLEMPRVETFVYFLVEEGEVVYVGKTRNGLARFGGHRGKDYDTIYIMRCGAEQLDELEDRYIFKYRPRYNKLPNLTMNMSLQNVKKRARSVMGGDGVTVWTVRRAASELGIEPLAIESTQYVKRYEAEAIVNHIVKAAVCDGA